MALSADCRALSLIMRHATIMRAATRGLSARPASAPTVRRQRRAQRPRTRTRTLQARSFSRRLCPPPRSERVPLQPVFFGSFPSRYKSPFSRHKFHLPASPSHRTASSSSSSVTYRAFHSSISTTCSASFPSDRPFLPARYLLPHTHHYPFRFRHLLFLPQFHKYFVAFRVTLPRQIIIPIVFRHLPRLPQSHKYIVTFLHGPPSARHLPRARHYLLRIPLPIAPSAVHAARLSRTSVLSHHPIIIAFVSIAQRFALSVARNHFPRVSCL
ncbi:hypothetical protein EXIGLDRAFT_449424 [Exidia glandulosa HHB12029]|uniref:Uncharacterized protein n=1 Tax=Exidia glandulosa HHB12029 TaxID=1314781 RepID=A0A165K853_EXIGL|nr:hypothetical protein EXIGLDRAFT_449424 [Exidia glandulosa HHB12029]